MPKQKEDASRFITPMDRIRKKFMSDLAKKQKEKEDLAAKEQKNESKR